MYKTGLIIVISLFITHHYATTQVVKYENGLKTYSYNCRLIDNHLRARHDDLCTRVSNGRTLFYTSMAWGGNAVVVPMEITQGIIVCDVVREKSVSFLVVLQIS